MNKLIPFLWFEKNANEALEFYQSVFKNLVIIENSMNMKEMQSITIEIDGQRLILFHAGPHFKFNESFSLFLNSETQEDIDYYWEKLSEGGEKGQCGWLKDKFGLSWQIIPPILGELLADKDRTKASYVLREMLTMNKIIISDLYKAYNYTAP